MTNRTTDPTIEVRIATGAADVETVRGLMHEYGEYLADLASSPTGGASICLVGYEAELASLPGAYVTPGGLLLAEVDGVTAGCAALKPLQPRKPHAPAGAQELKRLWVRPGFRGLGLGRALMEAAISHARATGVEAIYLDTVPAAMPEANRLYAAIGFAPVERYNDNPTPGVAFLELRL